MLFRSLMASTHTSFPPGLVFHQQLLNFSPFKDFPHYLLPTGSRQELIRSSVLSLSPHEQDVLLKSMRVLYVYSQLATAAPNRRMPVSIDIQDKQAEYVLSFDIDEQWTQHKKLLQILKSRSNELEKDSLDPSMFQDLVRIQAAMADMHLMHLAVTDSELSNVSGLNTILHPSGSYYDLEHNLDLVHNLAYPVVSDERPPFVGGLNDMKDLVSVLEEFKLRNDYAWRKHVLVPTYRWTDTIDLQDQSYLPSSTVDYMPTVPLKRPEKVKRKQSLKRKSKKGIGDRESYKSNSVQACEVLLSLMMDKNRNCKSVANSLKKAGPALPLLLTQFSASITGTGLAVMFSVIYRVACGSLPFCTSNLLVSGFGVGLFWLSWAVNKLRDTITYIGKKSTTLDFEEEEMMMRRVDKSVDDIFFRTAALMAVFILTFA